MVFESTNLTNHTNDLRHPSAIAGEGKSCAPEARDNNGSASAFVWFVRFVDTHPNIRRAAFSRSAPASRVASRLAKQSRTTWATGSAA